MLSESSSWKEWRWWLAACGLALLGFGAMGAESVFRHATFRSSALDLGYLDQVVWNTAHGAPFANTIKGSNWPSYLAGHFAPAIALLAPLVWVWDDVRVLLLAQAGALARAGLPVYALFRRYGNWVALAVLAAFYVNPWLHRGNLHDFHTMLLAAPLISLAVFGVIRHREKMAPYAEPCLPLRPFPVWHASVEQNAWRDAQSDATVTSPRPAGALPAAVSGTTAPFAILG